MTLYQIVEIKGRKHETYVLGFETEQELTHFLNGKRAMEDESRYSVVAWKFTREYGYIYLERYWRIYSRRSA